MAEVVKVVEPTEVEYVIKLTQSEVDFIVGILSDLSDNPQRRVRMVYENDESYVEPTEHGLTIANDVSKALASTQCDDYDYYEYWAEVVPNTKVF